MAFASLLRGDRRRAAPDAPAGQEWMWAMPELAVMFFVLAIIAFLWTLDRQESEQRRHTLIGDILWLEQGIRFHLLHNQDVLAQLAADTARGGVDGATFAARAASQIRNNPELTHVAWLDPEGKLQWAVPGVPAAWRAGGALAAAEAAQARELAVRAGRPAYTGALTGPDGARRVEVYVPAPGAQPTSGAVVAVYSLERVMHHLVPWWFAQKYRLQIADESGAIVGAKSAVAEGDSDLSYELPFDPPGQGLVLRATAYAQAGRAAENLLVAVTLGLSAVILWSLWLLKRHMARRALAEQGLRASHERFVAVLDGLDAAVAVTDPESRASLYANGYFREVFGPAAADGAFCSLTPWTRPEGRQAEAMDADLQDIASGRWYHLRSSPAKWVDGRHVLLEIATDITERRQAEELSRQQLEKLQFTSRLVTMGEMASTLAHELNQPLSAIASYNTGCLNTLRAGRFERGELMEAMEKMGKQARRAGRIIRSIHEFVRKSEPQRAPCELNGVVEAAVAFLQEEARKRGAGVVLQLAPALPAVHADRVLIEQLVLNLAKNALEAMQDCPPERRRVTITTAPERSGVQVTVADHGPGVPQEVMEKLFQPFFTTKAEGMGMGLNICRSIVEAHQGRLWVEPNPAGGSLFHFTLPA